ncbi:FkbM family methyltransferase [Marinoscillum furvescens DSM 4134]|uniref:FkbM family methyltransferase n=2 Tax=Marinoscillum furvescens TaxID=1026 RepID=A0A3D9L1E4_MARFU|nr:FkbM family methyltransferase [Marinoscillum furvescens DSM 4134]
MKVRLNRYQRKTERDTFEYIRSLDLKNTTVLDIGANKGIYSLFFAQQMLHTGAIWAFEPQPELKDHLHRISQVFSLSSLRIFDYGLSNQHTTAWLYRKATGHGGASLEVTNQPEKVKVRLKRLDDVVKDHPPKHPVSLIKCDIENHELQCLKGATSTLKRYHPTLIIECHDQLARSGELFEFLKSQGYQGTFFHRGTRLPLSHWAQYPYRKADTHRNYIFEYH